MMGFHYEHPTSKKDMSFSSNGQLLTLFIKEATPKNNKEIIVVRKNIYYERCDCHLPSISLLLFLIGILSMDFISSHERPAFICRGEKFHVSVYAEMTTLINNICCTNQRQEKWAEKIISTTFM